MPRRAVIAAIAEALPFASSTLACVSVAQAFHHLHSTRAIPELHRVLAPGGYLALIWNVYEATDPLKQAMDRVIRGARGWCTTAREGFRKQAQILPKTVRTIVRRWIHE